MDPLELVGVTVGVFAGVWTGTRLARGEWLPATLPLPALIAVAVVIPSMMTWAMLLLSVAAGFLAQRFLTSNP
jgi:hypothetical protein